MIMSVLLAGHNVVHILLLELATENSKYALKPFFDIILFANQ